MDINYHKYNVFITNQFLEFFLISFCKKEKGVYNLPNNFYFIFKVLIITFDFKVASNHKKSWAKHTLKKLKV